MFRLDRCEVSTRRKEEGGREKADTYQNTEGVLEDTPFAIVQAPVALNGPVAVLAVGKEAFPELDVGLIPSATHIVYTI